MNDKEYFAAAESEKLINTVMEKSDRWFQGLDDRGYLYKLHRARKAYHGDFSSGENHSIQFGGEQGELTELNINRFRNYCRHIITMVTASRPAFQSRATNIDYKSEAQTKLANSLMDYYTREKKLENNFYKAVESAVVLGSGYIKMSWDSSLGEERDYIGVSPEDSKTVHEGDIAYYNISPFNIVFDFTKIDNDNHDWVLVRNFKNKYDIAAQFPEHYDRIIALDRDQNYDDFLRYDYHNSYEDETDDIPIYEFYHRKTAAMPEGRYVLFVDSIPLMDTGIPYRELPIYRISPSDIIDTPYGYTDMFDFLPIQEALNLLHSTILTNQNTFGVQHVLVPRGTDIAPAALEGGLNFIEYNHQMGKPEALNLTSTPPEIFEYIKMLSGEGDTITGVNSVSRGQPDPSLKSGTALALVQAMSLQYVSGLQRSMVQLMESVAMGTIHMLKDFSATKRVATIVGKTNRPYLKEFTSDDLSNISRFIVDIGNPLSKTTAGKLEQAKDFLQMGLIRTPDQYTEVLSTGNLDSITDDGTKSLMLIRAENEKLIAGEFVDVVATEDHIAHIREHATVIADPESKKNGPLIKATLAHMMQHINALRTTDPDLLQVLGQPSLAPPDLLGAKGGAPATEAPSGGGQPKGGQPGPKPGGPPDQPKPPPPFENLPVRAEDIGS